MQLAIRAPSSSLPSPRFYQMLLGHRNAAATHNPASGSVVSILYTVICPALNLIKYVEWRRLPALLFGTGAARAWAVPWACATMSWDLLVLLPQLGG